MLLTVSRSTDPGADVESLCVGTLDGALSGVMDEVDEIQQAIQQNWPVLTGSATRNGSRPESEGHSKAPTAPNPFDDIGNDLCQRVWQVIALIQVSRLAVDPDDDSRERDDQLDPIAVWHVLGAAEEALKKLADEVTACKVTAKSEVSP